jgi:NADPH-dependent 7-cyano-7-deazaguanine reductase QueF
MMPTPIEIDERVHMQVKGQLNHLCPFVDETDNGLVTISWVTGGATLELHSLAAYLRTFDAVKISHEALTEQVRGDLSSIPGIDDVRVTASWHTAGLDVLVRSEDTCGISPTPQPNRSVTP